MKICRACKKNLSEEQFYSTNGGTNFFLDCKECVKAKARQMTPERLAYKNARLRCNAKSGPNFQNYTQRGVKFLFDSFDQFLSELGPRPSPKHSVDRIDNDGNYEPGNVRWATQQQQAQNQRRSPPLNRLMSINGVTRRYNEWCDLAGITRKIARIRRSTHGWCLECSLTIRKWDPPCLHRSLKKLRLRPVVRTSELIRATQMSGQTF